MRCSAVSVARPISPLETPKSCRYFRNMVLMKHRDPPEVAVSGYVCKG